MLKSQGFNEELKNVSKLQDFNEEESTSIIVPTTKNKGKRTWDKFHVCVFCSEKRAKMAQHLEAVHCEEIEVAEILAIASKSPQRKRLFSVLRKRGDFNHNSEVLKIGKGLFIPEWRPKEDTLHTQCEFCLGAYHKKMLKIHMKRCPEKPCGLEIVRNVQSMASMLSYTSKSASEDLKNVLSRMIVDDVSRLSLIHI